MTARGCPDLSVYLIADPALCGPLGVVETVRQAAGQGVTCVQLRDKRGPSDRRAEIARALVAILAPHGIPLIVNDDLDATLAAGAAGLHIGPDDLPPARARAGLGPGRWLGVSVPSAAAVGSADPGMVDYAGIGAVYGTQSKLKHDPPLGIDGFQRLRARVPMPVVAIGGIDAAGAGPVIQAGADGVAVISAICGQADIPAATRAIAAAVAAARAGTAGDSDQRRPRVTS